MKTGPDELQFTPRSGVIGERDEELLCDGVTCPHCGSFRAFELCDETDLVTYHGEGEPVEIECDDCEKPFKVNEMVLRHWEVVEVE